MKKSKKLTKIVAKRVNKHLKARIIDLLYEKTFSEDPIEKAEGMKMFQKMSK